MSLNIETSKDGYRILQVDIDGKKKYIGSKYNQKKEIDNFINQFTEFTEKNVYLIWGLSFGEHLKELKKHVHEDSKILVVELNNELIDYCKRDKEISKIIHHKQITIGNTKEIIKEFFNKYVDEVNTGFLQVASYCKYEKIFNKELLEIENLTRELYIASIVKRNTLLQFGEEWFHTLLKNLKYMHNGYSVNVLESKYKNKPAIIVSAGPSLSRNIDLLKGVDNALILSGGRTLAPLLDKGISPSCLGVIDPGEVSYKLVENYLEGLKCPLVFYNGTSSKVLEHHRGKKIYSSNNKFLNKILNQNIETLRGGGSVVHTLTYLAYYMGCNPIIFIGQDLAYTNDKGHDDSAGNKWSPLTFNDYKREDDFYVKSVDGGLVRTSLVLNGFRLELEDMIRNMVEVLPDLKFINATEGGAFIEGAEHKTLKETLDNLDDQKLTSIDDLLTDDLKTNAKESVINGLEEVYNIFIDFIKEFKKGQLIINDFRKNHYLKNQDKLNKNLRELRKIDDKFTNEIHNIDVLEDILFKNFHDIENNRDFIIKSKDNDNVIIKKELNKKEVMYQKMQELMEKCNVEIEKIIKELKS